MDDTMMDSSVPGKDACLEIKDDGIYLVFKTDADAIEMMPTEVSIFTRNKNVIVMERNYKMQKQIELNLAQEPEKEEEEEE